MAVNAFWKSLHTTGHDAAMADSTETGWSLHGNSVFLHEGQPTALRYALDLNPDWSLRRGMASGFIGMRRAKRVIERDSNNRWTLDGVRQPQVDGLLDLDFGFTPATNYPHLRRMALGISQRAEITVAWIDIGSRILQPLVQRYHRTGEDSYAYESPQGPYSATLRTAESGFVRDYPGLWAFDGG
jgi:hypothetical protein